MHEAMKKSYIGC